MIRRLMAILLCLLLYPLPAVAKVYKPSYTLPTKGRTVLQNEPDRGVAVPAQPAVRAAVPGESPVTGLPWTGDYLPMLAVIGNYPNTATVGGRSVKASGIGRDTPWGIQYADILYEELMFAGGTTRFIALFSDCFAQGQPAGGIGPVRSCRVGALLIREEWQAGLLFSGGFAGAFRAGDESTGRVLRQTGAQEQGLLFNTLVPKYHQLGSRVKGAKSPNNFNIDLIAIRNLMPDAFTPEPRPFLFASEENAYGAYKEAGTVSLDWGEKYNISHFMYDPAANAYTRYCGAGAKAAKWVPFTAFPSALERSEESRIPLTFANVIVQRVNFTPDGENPNWLVMQDAGRGNADIFIGGRYIPGYWVRDGIKACTVFYDDKGEEIRLNRGKTFIAHFPADGLCTVEETN